MSTIENAIKGFGPERRNLVWLPPLTLGYLFHLSGKPIYLISGVVCCGGSMVAYDLGKIFLGDGDPRSTESPNYKSILDAIPRSRLKQALLGLSFVVLIGCFILSWRGLYTYFTSDDLVIIGLVFANVGGLVTWLLNGKTLLTDFDEDADTTVSDLVPQTPDWVDEKLEEVFEDDEINDT